MDSFQKKTLVTARSLKYTYHVSRSGEVTDNCPALLFLHGFPDSAHLWTDVIANLGSVPNKIIIPDCLGYASTDKPEDTALYTYDGQAADLVDILGNENILDGAQTVLIGHDWGSALAQRTYLYHRELFRGIVLVNTGYIVPSADKFDLDAVNTLTEKLLGYPQFAYWELFTAPDAAEVINTRLDRMWQALHGDHDQWMKKLFCEKDGMRNFILGDENVPLRPYARGPKFRDHFMEQFSPEKGGFFGAFQMYKSTANNVQAEAFEKLPEVNLKIEVPILYFICRQDAVCLPELMMEPAKGMGLVPNLKEVVLDCAHWSPMEKPVEIATEIKAFLGTV
ncbi:hypothetical protein Sste5346_009750 [Sporothrix stenoceras]|uniref:AB hydrolase-1 domain-containing protein n=1 Tax=Sporothrix stenoceras TaxID=5173 RepID=A0ABR3YJD2_9PEZI